MPGIAELEAAEIDRGGIYPSLDFHAPQFR